MPSLLLDHEARVAIVSIITQSPETVSVITLPSGHQLRLFCHCGHVAIELVNNERMVQVRHHNKAPALVLNDKVSSVRLAAPFLKDDHHAR